MAGETDQSESSVSLISTNHRSQARKNHRRRKRSGSYKLVETETRGQHAEVRSADRGRSDSRRSGGDSRRSGYVNSGAETESELVNTLRRNKRRQRSRSRSPSEARARLPSELVKHIEFGLVEPETSDNPQEIPYINVETQAPVRSVRLGSSGRRSRHNSGGSAGHRRRLNTGDTDSPHHMASWQPPASGQYYAGHAQVS